MKIEERALSTIRPYQNNPRINDAAVDAVAASIQENRRPLRSNFFLDFWVKKNPRN